MDFKCTNEPLGDLPELWNALCYAGPSLVAATIGIFGLVFGVYFVVKFAMEELEDLRG